MAKPSFRFEPGPARRKSYASEEVLAILKPSYRQSMIDADGKPIAMGQEFTYLDWGGEFIWYVYRLDGESWTEIGQAATLPLAKAIVGDE